MATATAAEAAAGDLEEGQILECDRCRDKLEIKRVFPRTHEYVAETFGEEFLSLLLKKQIFFYDYVTDWSVLDETSLPPPDKFFNTLTNRPISSEDYQHAENVWRKLGFVNLGQYCEMYLILDILILGRTKRRSAIRFLYKKKRR